jgi:4-oxalomesaconate tautomerase
MQTAIPFMQFRGGSSKGLFFNASDLPTDPEARDQILLAAMEGVGPGDPRQIDGLGGGTSLTSKIAIVSLAETGDVEYKQADLDYLFVQVVVGAGRVSLGQTCGNMLAGVLPFAIESGMLAATETTTTARIRMLNTGGICEVMVQTPGGKIEYGSGPNVGTAKVDGVFGTAAPIICTYLDTAGATCGTLLPTGQLLDYVNDTAVTCIDNGMPVILLRASDFGLTGYETIAELTANTALKIRLEGIRRAAGPMMNLGDVAQKTIPKLCLVAPPQHGGLTMTRMFIPHVVHEAIGVLAAVSVATACVLPGSVADGVAVLPSNAGQTGYSVEHPTGEMTVMLAFDETTITISQSGVIRTARLLSRGEVFIPAGVV